jgi:hypothetical protein
MQLTDQPVFLLAPAAEAHAFHDGHYLKIFPVNGSVARSCPSLITLNASVLSTVYKRAL